MNSDSKTQMANTSLNSAAALSADNSGTNLNNGKSRSTTVQRTAKLVICALFTALTAVCSWISLELPFTLRLHTGPCLRHHIAGSICTARRCRCSRVQRRYRRLRYYRWTYWRLYNRLYALRRHLRHFIAEERGNCAFRRLACK